MDKVSIIIPNYNNEKYIIDCLNSVKNQNYSDIEIIVIDDGSTDNSVKIVSDYIKNNNELDIKLICQNNLNGAIARNEGLKVVTGKYLIFLDSDDMLDNNVINYSISKIKEHNCDLLIGNYSEINENNVNIKKYNFIKEEKIVSDSEILNNLTELTPNPTNKVYDTDIIRQNNISWGNVRIGQDLNFYLKYLLNCKKVYITEKNMYKYRVINTSISRKYDFRILDIVNCFDDVKKYYKKLNKYDLYLKYIPNIELLHYNIQMGKQIKFKNKNFRKIIVNYFLISENKIDYSKCINYSEKYKKIHNKFKLLKYFKFIYTSNIYRNMKNR